MDLTKLKGNVRSAEVNEKAMNLHLGYDEDYQRGSLSVPIRWDHLAELIAIAEREDENARLKAELEGELELRSVNEETTTLRKIIFKLEHEIAGLRAALVEERAKAEFLASKYHKDYEFFTYVWDKADGETSVQKAVALDKARAALCNPSETPISSGKR